MYRRAIHGWMKHFDFFIIDAMTLQLALIIAYGIRHNSWVYANPTYRKIGLLLIFCDAFIYMTFNTMHNVLKRGYYIEFKETLRHCIYSFGLLMLFLYFMKISDDYSRVALFLMLALHIAMSYCSRLIWKWVIIRHKALTMNKRRMVALLDEKTAEDVLTRLYKNPVQNYDIVGIILSEESQRTKIADVPVVASLNNAASRICQGSVDSIFVDCSLTSSDVEEFIDACNQMAIPIHYYMPAIYGAGDRYFTEKIGGTTVFTSSINYATAREQIAKRFLDIIGGLVGSFAALIIMLFVGPFIKKASPGPILYTQERIGLNGRRFKMYKIRSMYPDAEERKKELMELNRVADGRMFKLDNDPRVIGNEILPDGTMKKGIGDFIRRTSLDEFPQFFNVLMGHMSLVGTRPPTVDEWETYEYHHRARLACKPGITGLWQVSGRSEITDFEKVVQLDTHYISNWTVGMDLRILLKTFEVVFARKGAF